MTYDNKQIANELTQTALGAAYYGNALYVAKDVKGITPEDVSILEDWLSGRAQADPSKGLHYSCRLQEIANKVAAEKE